jgi:hypothetical protein
MIYDLQSGKLTNHASLENTNPNSQTLIHHLNLTGHSKSTSENHHCNMEARQSCLEIVSPSPPQLWLYILAHAGHLAFIVLEFLSQFHLEFSVIMLRS